MLSATERRLYVETIHRIPNAPSQFAEQIIDWLDSNMPEELEGELDPHAVDVAVVYLGLEHPEGSLS
jgi:hypothetical protein